MRAAAGRPGLAGRIFAVGGPAAIRGPGLARRPGAVRGMPLRFEILPLETCRAVMAAVFRTTAALDAETLAREMTREYARDNAPAGRPFHVDMAPVLKALPVRLTRLEAWAARQALPFGAFD